MNVRKLGLKTGAEGPPTRQLKRFYEDDVRSSEEVSTKDSPPAFLKDHLSGTFGEDKSCLLKSCTRRWTRLGAQSELPT